MEDQKVIAIGSDHAGFHYKAAIANWCTIRGYRVVDFGAFSEESVDYPDFAHPVANAIKTKEADLGVLICGSGNGVAMTANKHQEVRAALCWHKELAALAREHNNANVLCLPERFITSEVAIDCVEAFLSSSFEGGRHERRVSKISASKDELAC